MLRILDRIWRTALVAVVLSFSLSGAGHAQAVSVDSGFRPPDGTDDTTYTPQAQSLTQDSAPPSIALRIVLPEVTNSEQATWTEQRKNQLSQIGFGREIPAAYRDDLAPRLTWDTRSDGSLVSALSVTSPGASALRVAVYAGLGSGTELRFFSLADSAQGFEPLTQRDFTPQASELLVEPPTRHGFTAETSELSTADESEMQDPPVWSPVIEGETVGIEIILPSSAVLSTFSLSVDQVSHIPQSISQAISEPYYEPQHLSGIGRAACSHVDVQCRDVDSEASMTAKMIYTKGGSSFLCTGVLMHDSDDSSFIPYFLTAHHCIATQAAARTLATYWDFERSSCAGSAPTTVTQLTGGADLLTTDSESDSSLLRLRRSPPVGPDGRWYSGWTAATFSHPTPVYGVHHPGGDLKKYSAGTTVRHINALLGDERQKVKAVEIRWSQGVTEGGSSGSGLFDTAGRLRGILSGGPAVTCSASSVYGRFDRFFPHARPWLTAAPTGDDHGDTSDRATSVALGSSTQGHLERQADRDYFRFSLSGPGTLTVYTTGNTDTYGNLWGNGQWLAENDDGGTAFNFRIERAASAGTYYILVRGYDDRSTGRYTLAVRFTPKGGGGGRGSLNDLLGTWRFAYTIIRTFTQTYRLSRVDNSTGTPLIVGTNQYGNPVSGGRIQDISPGSSLPYEFSLLDPGVIICQFFLFDKTGTNRVDGVYVQIDDGECKGDVSNPYPMTGTRTSRAISGIQEQSTPRDTVLEQLSTELQSVEETVTLGLSSPDEADSAAIRDIIDMLSPALD